MTLALTLWAQLYLYPLLVTLALWGSLTMGLLWLNHRGTVAMRLVLVAALGVLLIAHQQLHAVRDDLSAWGCYRAFLAGMLIWAWHELAFYSGVLTGPWRRDCPPDAHGWQRFGYALRTHLYHEAAVVVEIGVMWLLLRGGTNITGLLTFGLMWGLQHSAKLNVLLGIRSLNTHLLPAHLRYLGSFWLPRTHNPFFLPSMIIISLLAAALWLSASALAPAERAVGMTLLAALTTLGLLEHLLLVLPASAQRQRESENVTRGALSTEHLHE
jgi:putative photosynthetic complex assembly protein 2